MVNDIDNCTLDYTCKLVLKVMSKYLERNWTCSRVLETIYKEFIFDEEFKDAIIDGYLSLRAINNACNHMEYEKILRMEPLKLSYSDKHIDIIVNPSSKDLRYYIPVYKLDANILNSLNLDAVTQDHIRLLKYIIDCEYLYISVKELKQALGHGDLYKYGFSPLMYVNMENLLKILSDGRNNNIKELKDNKGYYYLNPYKHNINYRRKSINPIKSPILQMFEVSIDDEIDKIEFK